MDLSYEARWLDLRRQLDVDIAYLAERTRQALDAGEHERAGKLDAKTRTLEVVRDQMDAADRTGASRA